MAGAGKRTPRRRSVPYEEVVLAQAFECEALLTMLERKVPPDMCVITGARCPSLCIA
jgi:hypothetical protein